MARPRGYWIKIGILSGILFTLVWGLTMLGLAVLGMDGDVNQILVIAPCVGLFFGVVFPVAMAWMERRYGAANDEDEL